MSRSAPVSYTHLYKFNKKLALRNRISGFILAEDVLDPTTGEVLAEAGTNVDMELSLIHI